MPKITIRPKVVNTTTLRIKKAGPQGPPGASSDSSLTPEVNAALGGAEKPSSTNVFITKSASLAQIIAFS